MHLRFKNKIYYIVFILLIHQPVAAQYSHFIQNYSIDEYKAGNQNWDITKAKDGKLYVANNKGLLEFDGLNWRLWEMPNKTTIRSVITHKDKIYVGSYEEFGYWKRNSIGILEYTSLVDSLLVEKIHDEEFWQITLLNDAVVFRSFLSIYIYDKGKISSHNLFPSTIMSCNVIGNELYISTLDSGIFILENNELKPFIHSEILQDARIVSITSKGKDQFLITTDLKGCFLYKNNKITTWKSEINSLLKKHQLNRFSEMSNGNMIFGTIKNGIYITDGIGNILFNLNKEKGFINNTILGLYIEGDSELWLGLDNGIASVDLSTPNSFYNDTSGKLGAVYDVISYNDIIYIGSNTGLYYLDKQNKLQFIEGTQGQVWDLQEIDGQLFCGHNNGTYLVDNAAVKKISAHTGGWAIKKIPGQNNAYIQATYSGLVSFKKINGEWKIKHLGKLTIPVRFFVFENKFTAWVADANQGLYRVSFDEHYENIISFKDYRDKGLWSDYHVRLYNLKNNSIVFHTIKGWQKYENLLDSIIPYNVLNDRVGKDSYVISEDHISYIAFKTDNVISFDSLQSNKRDVHFIPSRYYKKRLIAGYENVSKFNDSIFILNLYDGFMFINSSFFSKNEILNPPLVEQILINNQAIDIKTENIELPFKNNNLVVAVSSPTSKNQIFEYKLSNSNIESTWVNLTNGKVELSNLSDGEYKLSIRGIDDNLNKSSISLLKFKILSPWYKNKVGFSIYALLLIITSLIIYFIYKRKIKKEQKLIISKYVEEQKRLLDSKAFENEKRIVELKNESLKKEIILKSKQLANTAMAIVKKNEVLLILKKELLLNKSSFGNQYSFSKLIKQIDGSIEHEDEWKIFEYNFNQVHADFFNKLKYKFPDLTHKDLRICAYIKMNLSNKEIAPLLNISIRGLETHRYRLKGKFLLGKGENMTAFLQNF